MINFSFALKQFSKTILAVALHAWSYIQALVES